MNELDFLAWLILGGFVMFGVLPCLLGTPSDSYWEAVCVGVGFILALAVAGGLMAAGVWAVTRVIG
jgi:hypothetical protein